jgi:hypothetical protein
MAFILARPLLIWPAMRWPVNSDCLLGQGDHQKNFPAGTKIFLLDKWELRKYHVTETR